MRTGKDEFVENLNQFQTLSKDNFDKKLTEGVAIAQSVAETENMIYDFENKGKSK